MKKHLLATVVMALFTTGALAQNTANTTPTNTTRATAPNSMTDAEIAKVVHVLNEGEIDAGKAARSRTNNEQVKQFAQHMIDEHERMNKENKALAKRMNVNPKSSELSKQLESEAKDTIKKLKDHKDASLDVAYVDSQVVMHQKTLDVIKNTLLPNAKAPALKEMLEKATPAIEKHLEHAKELQASISKK